MTVAIGAVLVNARAGLAQNAISVQLGPGSQTTTAPTVSYTVDACATGEGAMVRSTGTLFTLDGVSVSVGASVEVQNPACNDARQFTGILSLVPGNVNKFQVSVQSLGAQTGRDSATYTYMYVKPLATSLVYVLNASANSNQTTTYTVTNVGNMSGTISFAAICDGAVVTSCNVTSATAATLNPQQATTVTVAYHVALAGGIGSVKLRATGGDASALVYEAPNSVYAPSPVTALDLTAIATSAPPAGQVTPYGFMVTTGASNYRETVNLQVSCPSPAGYTAQCAMDGNVSSIDVWPNQSGFVAVNLTAPNGAGVSGQIRLIGTVAGTTVADTAYQNYTTVLGAQNAFYLYADAGSDTVLLALGKPDSIRINIGNASNTVNDTYVFTGTDCDAAVLILCPVPAPIPLNHNVGAQRWLPVKATLNVNQLGQFRVKATSAAIMTLTHSVVVNVRTRPRFPIAPRLASISVVPNSDSAFTFNVQNQTKTTSTFSIQIVCPAVVQCNPVGIAPSLASEGVSAELRVAFHAGGVSGSGVLTVIAQNATSGAVDSAFYKIAVGQAVASSLPHTAPFVTIAPEQGDWRFKDTAKCLMNCFDDVHSFSTVPYYSMNTARSLTFTQRAIVRRPQVMLEFDIVDSSATPADSFGISLKRPNGSLMQFSLGGSQYQTLYFKREGASRFRIAVTPSVANDPTGVYDVTAIVSGIWSASEIKPREIPVRYVVRNERESVFGKGWMLEGFQALKSVSGGKLVLDGSGGWTYFASSGSSYPYQHTPGDFSTLRDSVSSGTYVGYVRDYPDGSRVTFDLSGRMRTARDAAGNTTVFNYSGTSTLLANITDPVGKAFTFVFGYIDASACNDDPNATWCQNNSVMNWVTDPAGRTTYVSDNGYGTLFRVRDAGGVWRQINYTPDADGLHSAMETDRKGNLWWSLLFALGGTKLTQANAPHVTVQGEDVAPVTTFSPRELQLLATIGGGGLVGGSLTWAARVLNADTIWASMKDPKGHVTKYRLDAFGAPTEVVTADGARTIIKRDVEGRVTQVLTPRGDTLDYEWNGPFLTRSKDRGANLTTDLQYLAAAGDTTRAPTAGHPFALRTLLNGVTRETSWFGALGVLDSTRSGPDTGPDTVVSRYLSDSRGRVTQTTDPRGHNTFTVYQTSGFQNTDSTYAEGRDKGTRAFYDSVGRVVATRDPKGIRDTTAYDDINRVTYTARQGRSLTYYYNALHLWLVDNSGEFTAYTPNNLGWVTSETNAGTQNYEYDLNGNATTWTNRRGQTISSTYDAMDRQSTITADGLTTSFFYDPQGRFSGTVRGVNRDTIKTDLAGRPDSVISIRNGQVYKQKFGYGADGVRATHRMLASNGYDKLTEWSYDQRGRLKTLTDPSLHGVTTMEYNQDGALKYRSAPGMALESGASGAHAPTALYYNNPALSREYAYEPLTGFISDRIRVDSLRGRRYEYDALGQLQIVSRYVVPDTNISECGRVDEATGAMSFNCGRGLLPVAESVYTYDAFGNRTDHGAVNYSNNRQAAFNGMQFGYDTDGNLIRKKFADGHLQRFSWSATGELNSVTITNIDTASVKEVVTFTYDGFGRRIKKSSSLGPVHEYLHDGDNLLAEVTVTGQIVSQYTNYPGVDSPHSVMYNGRMYNFAIEAPGSVTGLVSDQHVTAASWEYDAWGVPRTLTGADSLPIPLRFAAREYDAETGLYYNRARYYDPQTGRFISEDPIGLEGGTNQYMYAGNNPVNATDPSGLKVICTYRRSVTRNGNGDIISATEWHVAGCFDDEGGGRGGGGRSGDSEKAKKRGFGSCMVHETATNMRETDQGVRDAIGVSAKFAMSAVNLVGGISGRGLVGSGLATSGTPRLVLQWMLGQSAGADMVGSVFGYARIQGIRVGVTATGAALSGTALGVGLATNVLAGAAMGVAYQAGTAIGSGMVALSRCVEQ